MPNIKSAEKRVSVNNKKRLENKMVDSEVKNSIKKFNAAVAARDVKKAEELLSVTFSIIDSAVAKGIYHKNGGNNKKASISKKFSDLKTGKLPALEEKKKKKAKAVEAEVSAENAVAVKTAEKPKKAAKKEKEIEVVVKKQKPTKAEKADKKAEKPVVKEEKVKKEIKAAAKEKKSDDKAADKEKKAAAKKAKKEE